MPIKDLKPSISLVNNKHWQTILHSLCRCDYNSKMLLSTHFEIVCQAKKVSSPLLLIENAFPRCTACALTFFSRRMCVFLFISHVKDVKFFVCREYDVGSNITIFCLLRMASVKTIKSGLKGIIRRNCLNNTQQWRFLFSFADPF